LAVSPLRPVPPRPLCPAVAVRILRLGALLTVLLAFGRPARSQETETAVFRAGVADVRVVVQVTENGKLITDLGESDFVVQDEGQPQRVVYFAKEKEPLTLLLLLDISGSMRQHIEQMSEKAREALKYLSPGDRVGIMTFGLHSHLHFDFFDNHSEVARQLKEAPYTQDKTGYGTAINPAVVDACMHLDSDGSIGLRSILIVTDNLGLNYRANDEYAIGYLLKADASLNGIVIGRGIRPGKWRRGENPDFTPADVFKLAEATGGEVVKAEQAAAGFPEMIARIRERYTMSYPVPAGAQQGSFRSIKVSLSPAAQKLHPNAVLRHRSGYFVKQ
jgi:VWFA-related protein